MLVFEDGHQLGTVGGGELERRVLDAGRDALVSGHPITLDVDLVFDPRFSYGEDPATIEIGEHGVLASGSNGEKVVAVCGDGARCAPRPV